MVKYKEAKNMKYYIFTFGCQMNKSDSERIASTLERIGYNPAPDSKRANLVVVNMCSVRQSAVDRIHGKVKELNRQKKNKKTKTLLTGCIPKTDLKKFKAHFDYVLHIKSLAYWKDFLKEEKCSYYPDSRDPEFNESFQANYLKIDPLYSSNFSIFIPISTGCNNFCTFCIVPFTRGPLINRDHKKVLKEVSDAIEKGVKEIWFLGQNVNSYRSPTKPSINFAKLLQLTDKIKGDFWIRFTSSNPKDFSDELIKAIADSQKVTNYLNLPVQSGDTAILKKMQRPYSITEYRRLVKKIKKQIPDISLSTDVIVGFPGETKKQFQNTVKLFKEIEFDMAYIAQYSPRPGTAAFSFEDTVPKKEKQRREKVLTEVLRKTALKNNKNYIGKKVKVLVSGSKEGFLIGKSEHFKTVKFKGKKRSIGKFTEVEIADALPWGLKGK